MKKKTSIFLLVAALFAAIAVPAWAVGVMPEKMIDSYIDSVYDYDGAVIANFSKAADMIVTSEDAKIALPAAGENAIEIVMDADKQYYIFLKEDLTNPGTYVLFSRIMPVLEATEENINSVSLGLE